MCVRGSDRTNEPTSVRPFRPSTTTHHTPRFTHYSTHPRRPSNLDPVALQLPTRLGSSIALNLFAFQPLTIRPPSISSFHSFVTRWESLNRFSRLYELLRFASAPLRSFARIRSRCRLTGLSVGRRREARYRSTIEEGGRSRTRPTYDLLWTRSQRREQAVEYRTSTYGSFDNRHWVEPDLFTIDKHRSRTFIAWKRRRSCL